MLLVGVGTSVIQQAIGIDAIQYYLVDVLDHSGIKSDKGQLGVMILLGLVKLGFAFVGGKLFDKYGRRPLFAVSLLGTSVLLLQYQASFTLNPSIVLLRIKVARRPFLRSALHLLTQPRLDKYSLFLHWHPTWLSSVAAWVLEVG
jgi:MFS family permease